MVDSVHWALREIQQKLVAPKNQLNKFGGYNYRSCEDILEGLKKVMPECCTLTLSDDIVLVGERVYVKATACFRLGSESVEVTAYAREPLDKKGSDASQITGAASSYARKYALNGLFMCDDSKDADSTNDHGKGGDAKHQQRNQGGVASKAPDVKGMLDIINTLFSEGNMLDGVEYWAKTTADQKRQLWKQMTKDQRDWITMIMKNAPRV